MKKIALIAAVAAVVGLTSCKGDYTCTCTDSSGTQAIPYKSVSKKDATDACDATDALWKVIEASASCKLTKD